MIPFKRLFIRSIIKTLMRFRKLKKNISSIPALNTMKDNIPMSNSNESQRVSILTNLEKIKFKFKKFLVLNQTKKLKKRKEKVKKDRGT
jgi:hypothetical protein